MKVSMILSLAGLSLIDAKPISLRSAEGKRGLAYNNGKLTDLFQAGKVSWMYNWGSGTDAANTNLEYVPMLHSNRAEHTSKWNEDAGNAIKKGSKHIFSFNEPDQCNGGGACMQDVGATVEAHKQWVQPFAGKDDVKIGAPAVTNGVLSTNNTKMGLPYLKDFLNGCSGCQIDFVNAHWYDKASNFEYFQKHLQDVHDQTQKPVWVTEFGVTNGDEEGFLTKAIPWLDQQTWIERYAYQWLAAGSMANDEETALSSLGNIYATA